MSKKTILVIDDEIANCFLYKEIIKKTGLHVVTAESGQKGLEILKNKNITLVLLDFLMPDYSGLDTLKAIKNDAKLKNIPIIIISAVTEEYHIADALDEGAVDYIKKPVSEIELISRIRAGIKLKEYQDSLHELIKVKEQFVSTVTHDLRAPLSLFLQLTEDSAREIYSDDHIVDIVAEKSKMMLDYIEKTLNITFLNSGKAELDLKSVNLLRIAKMAKRTFIGKLKDKNINLDISINEDVEINVDETLFLQVINNLLGNAIKFTKENGNIHIYTRSENGILKLNIKDSGVGIEEKYINSIFTQFKKSYSYGTSGEQGTGLGLSICKNILDHHKFDISIKSKINIGTEFSITCGKVTL